MTFVLQLHFVKMKLNLKQKKMQKKDVLRFDYLLNASAPSHRTAIPSKLHLLVYSLFLKKNVSTHTSVAIGR